MALGGLPSQAECSSLHISLFALAIRCLKTPNQIGLWGPWWGINWRTSQAEMRRHIDSVFDLSARHPAPNKNRVRITGQNKKTHKTPHK